MKPMNKTLILYVPVIHKGYVQLFKRWYREARQCFILGTELYNELNSQAEDIRALDPSLARDIIRSLGIFDFVGIIDQEIIPSVSKSPIITSDDTLMRRLVQKYLSESEVEYDTTFLRWHEGNVFSRNTITGTNISTNEFDGEVMRKAEEESKKSSDWWRRVGAVLVIDGKIFHLAHGIHVPTEFTPYIDGDPRDAIRAGCASEFSTTLHAEENIFLYALQNLVSLKGADIYVTVFPCPRCAKLIARSGVRRCFFKTGHASLDGESDLISHGVSIIQVQ